jgi:V-type H+-transporting ATPase subunit a
MFRSQEMKYVQIMVNNESSSEVIQHLGSFGKLHMTDLQAANKATNNPVEAYVKHKRRAAQCDDLLKKLSLFRELLTQYEVELPDLPAQELKLMGDTLIEIGDALTSSERDVATSVLASNDAKMKLTTLREQKEVIQACSELSGPEIKQNDGTGASLLFSIELDQPAYDRESFSGGVLAGVLPVSSKVMFHRLLYRASKGGNFIVQFTDIEDPLYDAEKGTEILKTVFYVKTPFEELARRIARVCKVVGATIYPLPNSTNYETEITLIDNALGDTNRLEKSCYKNVVTELEKLAGHDDLSPLKQYEDALVREKKCCEAFMTCGWTKDFVFMRGWCPAEDMTELKRILGSGQGQVTVNAHAPPEGDVPPTYFRLNEFTAPFQQIVDTYGVPRYGEVNPGMFTCVTFPFTFGVMYGDIGHGTALMLVGLLLIFGEEGFREKIRRGKLGDGFQALFGARYCIAMMGFFGAYCGLLYNDCMSNPISMFQTTWHEVNETGQFRNASGFWPDPNQVIPFGLDQSWYHRENSLLFMNSMKMKIAVTLGVLHMSFGVVLSMFNHVYVRETARLFWEAIPRLIFLMATFGYMILMILIKFCIDWQMWGDQEPIEPPPPSLIQAIIAMFLSPANFPDEFVMYNGQAEVQLFLVIVALIMVPIMWYVPVWCKHRYGDHGSHGFESLVDDHHFATLPKDTSDEEHAKEEDIEAQMLAPQDHGHTFADDMIHQSIHTIEYVLGCVSNTASYLRLWALSLAHGQLAEVFWDMMLMEYGLAMNPVTGVVGVVMWTAATVSVLLMMDVLECFLHGLRLHWVEFQNKFYSGDGVAFVPFKF